MQHNINFFNRQPSRPADQGPVLVAIEGMDASGKQTQVEAVSLALHAARLAFPNYESTTGQLIREILKGDKAVGLHDERFKDAPFNPDDTALALQALMTVNRYEIQPWMQDVLTMGQSLILDRYYMSGVIYGQYDGLNPKWLYNIHGGLLKPDLYVYLDISVKESLRRRPLRDDAYEADMDRMAAVRELYNRTWKKPPHTVSWRMRPTRWVIVDGTQDKDTITKAILAEVAKIGRD